MRTKKELQGGVLGDIFPISNLTKTKYFPRPNCWNKISVKLKLTALGPITAAAESGAR